MLDKAVAWLTQAMTSGTNSRDLDARATLLHALSTRRQASFEMANSLNRERQSLSDTALAYLALTFANLDRAELAGEVLGILEPAGQDRGRRARAGDRGSTGPGSSQSAGSRGTGRDDGAGRAWPTPGSGRRRPSSTRRSTGCRPTASATAGTRTRPRARRSPPWRSTTAGPRAPRTATA